MKQELSSYEVSNLLVKKGLFPKSLLSTIKRERKENMPQENREYFRHEELMRNLAGDTLVAIRRNYRAYHRYDDNARGEYHEELYLVNLKKGKAIRLERLTISEDGLSAKLS
jgi:hypothetical protein